MIWLVTPHYKFGYFGFNMPIIVLPSETCLMSFSRDTCTDFLECQYQKNNYAHRVNSQQVKKPVILVYLARIFLAFWEFPIVVFQEKE